MSSDKLYRTDAKVDRTRREQTKDGPKEPETDGPTDPGTSGFEDRSEWGSTGDLGTVVPPGGVVGERFGTGVRGR